SCFPNLEILFDNRTSLDECIQALRALGTAIIGNVGKEANWGGKAGRAEAKDQLLCIREKAKLAIKAIGEPPGALDGHAAELLPLWYRLIGRVQGAYAAAKQQEGQLDFNDLERMTRDLLNRSEGARARYRQAEFRHVLVDEFQDTNADQWAIVQALADLRQPGSLFVVGDQKQSIYAFRGADVSVFGQVRDQLKRIGGPAAEVALARSFRTHQPLVDCFNGIFGRILRRDPASPVYEYETDLGEPMDAYRTDPPDCRPPLEFVLVETDKADASRRREAWEIARRLHEMVAAQVPVYDRRLERTRPVQYGDIALLFQSMGNIPLYEEMFKAQGLPFVTVAGRGYYDRPEVWDLLNLLRALYNPADNLSLATVLRSPLFVLSDDALLALRLVKDEAGKPALLWDALAQPDVVPAGERALTAFARDCLYDLAGLAGRVTISELLREALDRTGFLATLTGLPDGARRRGNVEKLLAKAESSGKITLSTFEQYLRDLSEREVREGEALLEADNAVTLMTVHASKGLEFPVVVLVDTSWERSNRGSNVVLYDPVYGLCCKVYDAESDSLQQPFSYRQAEILTRCREDAERRRLLYVAATRAQDYLLVCGQVTCDKKGQWSAKGWLGLLLDACDLRDELDAPGQLDIERDWCRLRVHLLDKTAPDAMLETGGDYSPALWDRLRTGAIPLDRMTQPPLLNPVVTDPGAAARHLSVTQVADLGAYELEPDYYGQRFRRSVLQDAPGHISPVPYPRSFRRLVGEIVHEALRWWTFDGDDAQLASLLESFAWEQGIVDEDKKLRAVREAQELLERYRHSEVYRWLVEAQVVYRELPFIYDNGRRIIHGVIDTLLRRPNGEWVIVDYKTSSLPAADQRGAEEHARRFHMQVGAYAAATAEQLQMVDAEQLRVYIHYVRYGLTVEIHRTAWQSALEKMEPYIGRLVGL
ncbi:MAG TPA: UvrD-helicase domain-containing protein, partial [Spirillospora sp.]|nr:UvrD-helicase domain-containing protein [Spirillospora sp.]